MATQVIRGNGSPEGFIEAGRGTFYINTQSYSIFVKIQGDETTNKGWRGVNIKGYYENVGDPDYIVSAPKYAMCYDPENDILYTQTKSGVPMLNYGWVSVNEGGITIGIGNPNVYEVIGAEGDLYIDNEGLAIYVCVGDSWDKFNLMTVDTTDIMIKLSELLTNTTSITSQYFNMFFNPTPMDIELAQYDSDGILRTYNIPNRAKDSVATVGMGNPEGNVTANKGQLYLDAMDGVPYIKTTELDKNTGWLSLRMPSFTAPLIYDEHTNVLSIATDAFPIEGSTNMLNSHTILGELDKIRNGNPNELFSVAEPVMGEHASTKNYVDAMHSNMFGYDSATRTLYINAPLNTDVTEAGTVMGQAGSFFTPMFGSAFSTVFTLTTPLVEAENQNIYVYSTTPCSIIFTTVSGVSKEVVLDGVVRSDRCFSEEMTDGIKTIQVTSTPQFEVPTVDNVKGLMKAFTMDIVEVEVPEEG